MPFTFIWEIQHTSDAISGKHFNFLSLFGVFTSGLSYGTDDNSLKDAFSSFGEVVDGKCYDLNRYP